MTHEQIRTLLPLAASGSLSREEMRSVEQHARECQDCRRELDVWGSYARGLSHLPQPELPAHLIARTEARILREQERATEKQSSFLLFGGLAALSWLVNFLTWEIAQSITGGKFNLIGLNLVAPVPWFLFSFLICSTSTIAVAVSVKHYRGQGRSL